jgi:hypothetical protein
VYDTTNVTTLIPGNKGELVSALVVTPNDYLIASSIEKNVSFPVISRMVYTSSVYPMLYNWDNKLRPILTKFMRRSAYSEWIGTPPRIFNPLDETMSIKFKLYSDIFDNLIVDVIVQVLQPVILVFSIRITHSDNSSSILPIPSDMEQAPIDAVYDPIVLLTDNSIDPSSKYSILSFRGIITGDVILTTIYTYNPPSDMHASANALVITQENNYIDNQIFQNEGVSINRMTITDRFHEPTTDNLPFLLGFEI